MDAEQAWQSALGQLQMEMPKASFDTWVRDTRLASYEDGLFTIGVRNAYARDWLESRISSTAVRLLMGMMNRSVDVLFVVDDPIDEPAIVEGEPTVEEAAVDTNPAEPRQDELLVEAQYDMAYDEIVMPDHVTLVPAYFRKHLPVIGVDLGWLYMGFRQAAFNAGARNGSKRERFSGKTIAALSGIAESTFWNRIGRTETWDRLKGLVTTVIATPEWDQNSATPRRLPRKYMVSMTLPLTAADARSLRTWLTANLEGLGGPEITLEAAAKTSLDILLPPENQAEIADDPETVSGVVRSLFADAVPSEHLAILATRLQKHIMPDSDRVGVTHFFVEHVLPHLGAGPGWMLTLLRDRCWVNRDTGEMRNQVTVPGGYAEIASWLGVTPGTIWRWQYGRHSESRGRRKPSTKGGEQRGPGRQASEIGKLTNPVLRVYLRETTQGKAPKFLTSPRTFDVLLDEVPLEILEAALDKKAGLALRSALEEGADLRAVCSIEKADSRAVCSIGFARFVDDDRAVCSIILARFVDHLRAVCRVFKSLNLLNQSLISKDSPPTPQTTMTRRRGAGNQAFWDFDFLMTNNLVGSARQIKDRQKETGASIGDLAAGFVSWLLYAYSPAGSRIDDPVALAVKRLRENIHAGAGSDFDRLARLKPYELKDLFDRDLAGELYQIISPTPEQTIYAQNYRHQDMAVKRELYCRLFGGS